MNDVYDTYDTTFRIKAGATKTLILWFEDEVTRAPLSTADIEEPTLVVKRRVGDAEPLLAFEGTNNTALGKIAFTVAVPADTRPGEYLWQYQHYENSVLDIAEGYNLFIIEGAL